MDGRSALRVAGKTVGWLGVAAIVAGIGGAALFNLTAAPCPPSSLCEGPGLFWIVGIVVAAAGAVVSAIGFIVSALARRKP